MISVAGNNKKCIFVNIIFYSHYSKSQIFVQKFNFDKNPNIFTSFSPNFFFSIFLVKSKLSTAKKFKTTTLSRVFHPIVFDNFLVKSKLSTVKKSETTTYSRVFHPKKIDNSLGKSKLNFWTKNEDFEQCATMQITAYSYSSQRKSGKGSSCPAVE